MPKIREFNRCHAGAALIVLWALVDGLLLPPFFGGTDIYFFKDAGVNFAQGLGLVTRLNFGNLGAVYRDFSVYPPLYPLVYGLYASLAGVSTGANQLFNTLVAIGCGSAAFAAVYGVLRDGVDVLRRAWAALLLLAVLIAAGVYGVPGDRPDGLAAIIGVLAIIAAADAGAGRRRAALVGGLCALALLTSPFAGTWSTLAAAVAMWARWRLGGLPLSALARALGFAIAGGSIVLLAALALIALFLPGWLDGFFGVALGTTTNNTTGSGYFLALLRGDVATWRSGFPPTSVNTLVPVFKLAAVQLCLLAALLLEWRRSGIWNRPAIVLLVLSPLCLITSPYQLYYLGITTILLFAAWAMVARLGGAVRIHAAAMLTALCAVSALTAPFELRDRLMRVAAAPSLARASHFIAEHRSAFTAPGRFVAVSPTVYMLWRQEGVRAAVTASPAFDSPAIRTHLSYVALAYVGTGQLEQEERPVWFSSGEYGPAFRPHLPQPAIFLGRKLSNSSQTWESALFFRRDCRTCPLEAGPPGGTRR